jgi:uncharacterized membrane protein
LANLGVLGVLAVTFYALLPTAHCPPVVGYDDFWYNTFSMADAREQSEYESGLGLERLIFFSDAVFAIAITLLVLNIKLPGNLTPPNTITSDQLLQAVVDQTGNILGYAIGFLVLGVYWIVHHHAFQYIKRYDGRLLWINIIFLMFVAFLPFPTSLLGQYGNLPFAVCFYAASVAIAGLMSTLIWLYATYQYRLVDPALDPQVIRYNTIRGLVSVAVFLASIPVALFIDASYGEFLWLLLFLLRPLLRPLLNARRVRSTAAQKR